MDRRGQVGVFERLIATINLANGPDEDRRTKRKSDPEKAVPCK
jgi:hypothetical protein